VGFDDGLDRYFVGDSVEFIRGTVEHDGLPEDVETFADVARACGNLFGNDADNILLEYIRFLDTLIEYFLEFLTGVRFEDESTVTDS
jgi:hypothetical protein